MGHSPIYRCAPVPGDCLDQGEILSGVVRVRLDPAAIGDATDPRIVYDEYSNAIVVSQSCDLVQDFNGRQDNKPQLPDILFCQVPSAQELKVASGMNSKIWDRVKKNKDERYHFLEKVAPECDACGEGLPELGIDFKRYFTLPTTEVYRWIELGRTLRRTVLCSPYLEHLSSRFAYFMSRVALPQDHVSE